MGGLTYRTQDLQKPLSYLEVASVAPQEMVLLIEPMAARSRRRSYKQDWQTWTRRITRTLQYRFHPGRRIKVRSEPKLSTSKSRTDLFTGKKITPNVRRILMYQWTFAHYLVDEEAQLSQSGESNTPAVTLATNKTNLPRGRGNCSSGWSCFRTFNSDPIARTAN